MIEISVTGESHYERYMIETLILLNVYLMTNYKIRVN